MTDLYKINKPYTSNRYEDSPIPYTSKKGYCNSRKSDTFNGSYNRSYNGYYNESNNESNNGYHVEFPDFGPEPFAINIDEATKRNPYFRTALWTGDHLQVTLMSIGVGEDIGLEIHPELDQFIRIEEGQGLLKMGDRQDWLDFQTNVYDDFAFVIPAGKWHNLINTGTMPIKLYSIYAPPQHPKGTVHETKEIAEQAEHNH